MIEKFIHKKQVEAIQVDLKDEKSILELGDFLEASDVEVVYPIKNRKERKKYCRVLKDRYGVRNQEINDGSVIVRDGPQFEIYSKEKFKELFESQGDQDEFLLNKVNRNFAACCRCQQIFYRENLIAFDEWDKGKICNSCYEAWRERRKS